MDAFGISSLPPWNELEIFLQVENDGLNSDCKGRSSELFV